MSENEEKPAPRSVAARYLSTTDPDACWGEQIGGPEQARAFTPEQAKEILELAHDPWRTMFAIAAYAVLRAGEIRGLSVEDVDLTRGVLSIRKTAWYGQIQTAKSVGSESTIPIAENLAEMLRKVIGERQRGLLFVNKAGRPYTSSGKVVQKRLWPL